MPLNKETKPNQLITQFAWAEEYTKFMSAKG